MWQHAVILNIKKFKWLKKCNDSFTYETKTVAASESLYHSLNQFDQNARFIQEEAIDCLYEWIIELMTHLINSHLGIHIYYLKYHCDAQKLNKNKQ